MSSTQVGVSFLRSVWFRSLCYLSVGVDMVRSLVPLWTQSQGLREPASHHDFTTRTRFHLCDAVLPADCPNATYARAACLTLREVL